MPAYYLLSKRIRKLPSRLSGRKVHNRSDLSARNLGKTYEYNIKTHHLFVDFRAAYNSVKRGQLYRAMEDLEILQKLIKITKITMKDSVTQNSIQSSLSEPQKVNNGLRQGLPAV
jgi:hypothetical protein